MMPAMQPCPTEETIQAFAEGRLRPAQRAAVEAHAARCEPCGSLLAAVTTAWFAEGKLRAEEPRRAAFVEGQRVGPYTILARAGSGSMGDVYRARDERLGRDVALKTLPERFASDPDRLARFRQEARAAGALSHPNVLTVFDVGAHEGTPYLVTEWLEGATLHARLAEGPLPEALALRIGRELARGLAAAHDKGIVHRDLKPANIFLCEGGACKILDFGLAKLAEALDGAEATQPGVIIGTAGYMAPEQVRGRAADHRADVFALGAVLHEVVTGRPPFGGGTAVDRMSATLRDEPPRVHGALGAVITRCLAKDPGARFQSAHDLAFFLESMAIQTGSGSGAPRGLAPPEPRVRRRPRRAAAAIGAAAAIAAAAAGGSFLARGGSRAAGASPGHATYRPLTFRRGQVLSARFSEGGHGVLYGATWEGGPPELFAARAEGPGARSLGVSADVLSVSSRGELALLLEPRPFDPDHKAGTLARMPIGGGAPRAVLEEVQEADWGPGGAELAVVRRVGGRHRLEYPAGTVRHETEGWISYARVSPRGDRIAFLSHPNPKDDRGSVVVIGAGPEPRELSGEWASAAGLAWDPGGERIWFTASKADAANALFSVDLDGRVRLEDRAPGRLLLHDVAEGGRALVDHQSIRMGLVSGEKGGDAERELTWSDNSFLTDISPDGRRVIFAETGESEGPSYGAYLRATDGAPPVRLGDGQPLAISPDGEWVLTMRYGPPLDLSLLPTAAGPARPLAIAPVAVVLAARWFPDGKRLLLRAGEAGRVARLWTYEIGAAAPVPVTPEGVAPVVAISPDGARMAGVDEGGALRVLSDRGDDLGAVPGRFRDQLAVAWDRGGDAVYVRTRALPVRVSRVELATGAAAPHLTLPPRTDRPGLVSLLTMAMSADGQSYAYCYYEVLSRLYLVEGLSAAPGGPE